jgi:hypothetical protein
MTGSVTSLARPAETNLEAAILTAAARQKVDPPDADTASPTTSWGHWFAAHADTFLLAKRRTRRILLRLRLGPKFIASCYEFISPTAAGDLADWPRDAF